MELMEKIRILGKNVLCLFTVMALSGCIMLGKMKQDYKEEWLSGKFKNGTNNHVDELLNSNGFFAPCNDEMEGPLVRYYIFYNDGSYLNIYLDGNTRFLRNMPNLDLCAHIFGGGSKEKPQLYFGGFYALRGDTLVLDHYENYGMEWIKHLQKEYFKIVDRNHIRKIGFQRFKLSTGPTAIGKQDILYEFVPASNLPPAGCVSIKNDRNMWYDENEWKEWMKKMKRPGASNSEDALYFLY